MVAFQCIGLLFCTLLIQHNHQRQLTLKTALEYNAALAKLRHVRRRVVRHHGRLWRNPGGTDHSWQKLFNGVLPEAEWKMNSRMDRQTFMKVADELRHYLQPNRSPRDLDVLPATEDEMREQVKHMENKHGFPQAFGWLTELIS